MEKKKRATASRKNGYSKFSALGFLMGLLLSVLVAWLFYDSFWGILVAVLLVPVSGRIVLRIQTEKLIKENVLAIKEMLLLLSSFLQAGMSLENAFVEAERELGNLFPEKNRLRTEIHRMNQQVAVSVPVEKAFAVLAKNIDLEEAHEFADVLYYAKRLGGNYIQNIQRTAMKLEEKLGVTQEIDTLIAEKRFEFYIMMGMPILILSYIKFTSIDFISGLYHNAMGAILMSGCLVFYILMILLGKKIIQIRV